jgi:hypothetical protein
MTTTDRNPLDDGTVYQETWRDDDAAPSSPAEPTETAHRIILTAQHGHVRFQVTCRAEPDSPCRQICEGAARGLCDEAHDVACDRDLVDGGECLAALWLNETDPDDILAAYVGPDGVELNSAPVAVHWSSRDVQWQWMYAVDLPEGTTAQEWTLAQT